MALTVRLLDGCMYAAGLSWPLNIDLHLKIPVAPLYAIAVCFAKTVNATIETER
jgi:hypothetical protein